ncbi:MAG: carboxymuconolactone decarboxylase family protein, partial [Desulfuromonadales bacterium]|nr:carboxymuconolactone decarboxylase family protein [Desulfuromonadales bacterium]
SELFSDLEKDVLAYTEAMSATPVNVADELYQRLEEHLDPVQMVELTAAIALQNFSARFNRAFQIAPED